MPQGRAPAGRTSAGSRSARRRAPGGGSGKPVTGYAAVASRTAGPVQRGRGRHGPGSDGGTGEVPAVGSGAGNGWRAGPGTGPGWRWRDGASSRAARSRLPLRQSAEGAAGRLARRDFLGPGRRPSGALRVVPAIADRDYARKFDEVIRAFRFTPARRRTAPRSRHHHGHLHAARQAELLSATAFSPRAPRRGHDQAHVPFSLLRVTRQDPQKHEDLMSSLLARKSVQDCENDILERGGLKRSLGKWHLTALGVGATIGAGIFATTGTAIVGDALRPGAGPAIVLSFLLTALTCGFAALCYAEFAAMVPISGSAYTYAYASLGELVAWIIGWDLIIEYAVGNIGVAIGWSGYFRELLSHFGVALPAWLATDYPIGPHGGRGGRGRGDRCLESVSRLGGRHRTARLRVPVHRQSARLPRRRAHHVNARHRHPGVGELQQRDGAAQDRHHPVLRARVGITLIRPRKLEQPGHRRLRPQRVRRHQRGRGDHLLQLHRVRRDVHRGGGGQGSGAGHAVRHHHEPGGVHGALHRPVGRS